MRNRKKASIDYKISDKDKLKLVITGKLDAETTGRLWPYVVAISYSGYIKYLGELSYFEYFVNTGIYVLKFQVSSSFTYQIAHLD